MRPGLFLLLVAALLTPVALAARDNAPAAPAPIAGDPLKTASMFDHIGNRAERSRAIFTEMGKVIQSPRCLNCHPRTDRPTQTDAMLPHQPAVTRGVDGHGVPALRCSTCHGDKTVDFVNSRGSIPGNPIWHLAPREMAWQGKTLREICEQIKDPARNGHKSLQDLVEHHGRDHLVGWAWRPGHGRKPAPGTQAQFGELTQAWIDTGAQCPVSAARERSR
jgi:hypothetical protein